MRRTTGTYQVTRGDSEEVRAFVPVPLPPANPPLALDEPLMTLHAAAVAAVGKLSVAGAMVPSPQWFIYGFVRKEAVVSSEIEGTQACVLELVVAPEDVGKVIGKKGIHADAIRRIVHAVGGKNKKRYVLEILEDR